MVEVQLCRHHAKPGGCKYGASCTFSHDGAPPAASHHDSHSNSKSQQGKGNSKGRNSKPPFVKDTRMAPNGHCRSYYHDGTCRKGFECRFSHAISLVATAQPSAESIVKRTESQDYAQIATNLNTSALTRGVRPADREGTFKILWRKILDSEYYCFTSSAEVHIFTRGLLSTTIETTDWDFSETQGVLALLAQTPGNAISRLRDILVWKDISIAAGNRAGTISFQRAFVPLFLYLSSRTVLNSPSAHHVNALYAVLHANAASWASTTIRSIRELVEQKSLKDTMGTTGFKPASFLEIFKPLTLVLNHYLSRFAKALAEVPELVEVITELNELFEIYATDILSPRPTFVDTYSSHELRARVYLIEESRKSLRSLDSIIERVQGRLVAPRAPNFAALASARPTAGTLAVLEATYDPPGTLRVEGPRHDNDFANIREIAILPSHEELLCSIPPYLPANIPSAPHHLNVGSIDRQLDIIFRLLREDSVGPIRGAVTSLLYDLGTKVGSRRKDLMGFLTRGGGRWRSKDNNNSVDLNLYNDVNFVEISVFQHQLTLVMSFRPPPGFQRATRTSASKKLEKGNTVGLLHHAEGSVSDKSKVYLGTIVDDVSVVNHRHIVRVHFHDPEVYLAAVQNLNRRSKTMGGRMIFFEVPGFLLSTVEPFLTRLQTVEPTSIPFDKIIAASTVADFVMKAVEPPQYARNPQFSFKLGNLLKVKGEELSMDANDENSISTSKETLKMDSGLDDSQVEALVNSLTREVAMIEGPPGTGKSYVGIKVVETLLANNITPILVICYTNHALDQFLEHILSSKATNEIVRCGSRSKSETIQAFSLYELTRNADNAKRVGLNRELYVEYSNRETIEAELTTLCSVASLYSSTDIKWTDIYSYLQDNDSEAFKSLSSPPRHLVATFERNNADGWEEVQSKDNAGLKSPQDMPFNWWKRGADIDLYRRILKSRADRTAQRQQATQIVVSNAFQALDSDEESEEEEGTNGGLTVGREQPAWVREAFAAFKEIEEEEELPDENWGPSPDWLDPRSKRSLEELQDVEDLWKCSKDERTRLLAYWTDEIVTTEVPRLARLRAKLVESKTRITALQDQTKLAILKKAKVIGCTTNGAANILPLLSSAMPRVLIVEEAGECLESHVLVNLVASIEHLILIGDHLQLRPQIASYNLSVESSQGKMFRLDESMFERLVNAKVPFSMLETQRRMRPEVSELIRKFLYPKLIDHTSVLELPHVLGMSKDVSFFNHSQAEDQQERDSSSRTNTYEAKMIVDLVVHLVKQGYKPGDVAVLTAYLGQLRVIKALLAQVNLHVQIHERDQEQLGKLSASDDEDGEEEEEDFSARTFEQRTAESMVTLRSVDNFQGEEAKVVILSLVRNSKTSQHDDEEGVVMDTRAAASIGFLKSPNRANVALSRAQEGMIIFGNAELLKSKSPMWNSVIRNLEAAQAVTNGLHIRCDQHPNDQTPSVNKPGVLSQIAPLGGCLRPCGVDLRCGHFCKQVCHPIDKWHVNTKCPEDCAVLLDCGHPCRARCCEPHSICLIPIALVQLPCGHEATEIPCSKSRHPEEIKCQVKLPVVLPCGHQTTVSCGISPSEVFCSNVCGANLAGCSHTFCKGICGTCRPAPKSGKAPIKVKHAKHACSKPIVACSHLCKGDCGEHTKLADCGPCMSKCERGCSHRSCDHSCGMGACTACLSACAWFCEHQGACNLACAMSTDLSAALLEAPVRPFMLKNSCVFSSMPIDLWGGLFEADLPPLHSSSTDLSERTITLGCKHAFTVETLDGLFEMTKYYSQDQKSGEWNGLLDWCPSLTTPSICPNCRAPISSLDVNRYGRILKRSSLGIQQQVAMTRSDRTLYQVEVAFSKLPVNEMQTRIETSAGWNRGGKVSHQDQVFRHHRKLLRGSYLVTPLTAFTNLIPHGLSSSISDLWSEAIKDISKLYVETERVARTPSPFAQAYGAAFTFLYQQALDSLAGPDEKFGSAAMHEQAMTNARITIGSGAPRAELKASIRALWMTVKLRHLLLHMGRVVTAQLQLDDSDKARANILTFSTFLRFLIETCLNDTGKGIYQSRQSQSHKMMVQTAVLQLRSRFELARLDLEMEIFSTKRREPFNREVSRARLAAAQATSRDELEVIIETYCLTAKGNVEKIGIIENFLTEEVWPSIEESEKEWEKLDTLVGKDTFYEAVTADEMKKIMDGMAQELSTYTGNSRGHWYTCPNGHVFTIGECGMAMVLSDCPECGARIGGTSHQLVQGNARADDLERLL